MPEIHVPLKPCVREALYCKASRPYALGLDLSHGKDHGHGLGHPAIVPGLESRVSNTFFIFGSLFGACFMHG